MGRGRGLVYIYIYIYIYIKDYTALKLLRRFLAHPVDVELRHTKFENNGFIFQYNSYHISGSLLQVARTKTVTSDHLITFID